MMRTIHRFEVVAIGSQASSLTRLIGILPIALVGRLEACRPRQAGKLVFQFHWGKHGFRVVRNMTAFSIEAFARDVRRAHTLITGSELSFFGELLQFLNDDCTAREKHWQTGTDIIVENKEL